MLTSEFAGAALRLLDLPSFLSMRSSWLCWRLKTGFAAGCSGFNSGESALVKRLLNR
jgi:hypothetical protein